MDGMIGEVKKEFITNIAEEKIAETNFCEDCIYSWCATRNKVSFCSLKVKGFFECKSCMLKLGKNDKA
jgi:hypothetical protein